MVGNELNEISTRYERRKTAAVADLYNPVDPYVVSCQQEKLESYARWLRWSRLAPLSERRILEIGCGRGSNLLLLLLLGAAPRNLFGNDLLADRMAEARERLPADVHLLPGDACGLELQPATFDVVLQSTVFTSILDDPFQEKLAEKMWTLVKPGGGVLWYDFVYDNPKNRDVRGVPVRRIRELFPDGRFKVWRLTLAPPLGRPLARISRGACSLLNRLPFLRTHVLCWIRKNR